MIAELPRRLNVYDLNETVDRIHPTLERHLGDDIELSNVLSNDLGTITADPNHVEQVLMNLAMSARDALPTGGIITCETANVEIDEAYAQRYVHRKPGRYVMLSERDTGTGKDSGEQDLPQILLVARQKLQALNPRYDSLSRAYRIIVRPTKAWNHQVPLRCSNACLWSAS